MSKLSSKPWDCTLIYWSHDYREKGFKLWKRVQKKKNYFLTSEIFYLVKIYRTKFDFVVSLSCHRRVLLFGILHYRHHIFELSIRISSQNQKYVKYILFAYSTFLFLVFCFSQLSYFLPICTKTFLYQLYSTCI